MRKKIYNLLILILLIICFLSLVSCSAITAQNIDPNSSPGMGGCPGGGGGPGMGGGGGGPGGAPGMDDRGQHEQKDDNSQNNDTISKNLIDDNTSENLIGKINSIDGNSIKIELISLSNENSNDNLKITYTGTYKTLEISDTVNISQKSDTDSSSESSLNTSDLKKDEILLVKYKENTELIENITIIKS